MEEEYPWEDYKSRLRPWIPEEEPKDPFSNLNDSFNETTPITRIGLIEDWEGYDLIADESIIDACTGEPASIEEFKFLPFIFLKDTSKYEAFTVYKTRVWTLKDKTLRKRDISHFYQLENERNFLLNRYTCIQWMDEPKERPHIFGDVLDYPAFIRSLMQIPPFTEYYGTVSAHPATDPFVRVVDNEEEMDEKIDFKPYPTPTPYYLGGLFTFFVRHVILPREWERNRRNNSPCNEIHWEKRCLFFNFLCFLPQSLVLLNKYMTATVLSEFSFHGFYRKKVDIDRYFWNVNEMEKDQRQLWLWSLQFKNFYNSLQADESITSFLSLESLLNEAFLLQKGFENIFKERKEAFNAQQIKLVTYREEKMKNEEEDRRFVKLLKECEKREKEDPEKFKTFVRKYADLFKGIFGKE